MKISDVLDKAADLIEPEGAWTQGSFCKRLGEYRSYGASDADCWCIVGAVGLVDSARLVSESSAVERLWRDLGLSDWTSLSQWNDAHDRTQTEVIAKLREAAAKAREQGQ